MQIGRADALSRQPIGQNETVLQIEIDQQDWIGVMQRQDPKILAIMDTLRKNEKPHQKSIKSRLFA